MQHVDYPACQILTSAVDPIVSDAIKRLDALAQCSSTAYRHKMISGIKWRPQCSSFIFISNFLCILFLETASVKDVFFKVLEQDADAGVQRSFASPDTFSKGRQYLRVSSWSGNPSPYRILMILVPYESAFVIHFIFLLSLQELMP